MDNDTLRDAMTFLFDKTFPIVEPKLHGFSDNSKAWQCFLKTRYLMSYAESCRDGRLAHRQASA